MKTIQNNSKQSKFTRILFIVYSLFLTHSCNLSNDQFETVSNLKNEKADEYWFSNAPNNGLSFYLVDMPLRIGLKLNEQIIVDNLDTINLVHLNGDTTISLSNFHIVYDSTFHTAYFNFKGVGTLIDTTKGKYFYNYMVPLTVVDNGTQEILSKPPRVEHTCKSWEAPLIDLLLGCNCCDMLWKDGLIIGCTCKCTWGICMYEKKIITENPTNNPYYISSTIIPNVIEK